MATANTTTHSSKQSRKELLKREDAFINAAQSGAEWATTNKSTVITVGVVLAALITGGVALSEYLGSRAAKSSNAFLSAMGVVEARIIAPAGEGATADTPPEVANPAATPPTFASEKDRDTAARDAFEKVAELGGGSATLARFMVADLTEKLGEKEAAEKLFAELVGSLDAKDSLFFLAVERLAYAQEARGDQLAAIATLDKLKGDAFYADYATFHQGRLRMAKGDKEEARKLFTKVKESYPKSSILEQTNEYLALLGPAPAAPEAEAAKAEAKDEGQP